MIGWATRGYLRKMGGVAIGGPVPEIIGQVEASPIIGSAIKDTDYVPQVHGTGAPTPNISSAQAAVLPPGPPGPVITGSKKIKPE